MKLKIITYFFLLTFSIFACTKKVCELKVSSFDLNKNYQEELDFSAVVMMLFVDAKQTITKVVGELKEM
jgi:hypothetical protein